MKEEVKSPIVYVIQEIVGTRAGRPRINIIRSCRIWHI